jgi:quercetin dioxygenase-like cupin family protein
MHHEVRMSVFHDLDKIPPLKRQYGDSRILSGTQGMTVWARMNAGVHIAAHQHPNEQTTWVMSGRMECKLENGEQKICGPGDLMLIPGGVVHEVWYLDECEIVEFFTPPRFDLYPAAQNDPYGRDG